MLAWLHDDFFSPRLWPSVHLKVVVFSVALESLIDVFTILLLFSLAFGTASHVAAK